MRRYIVAIGGTALLVLAAATTVLAGGPNGGNGAAGAGAIAPSVLGLTQAQVRELRGDGLTLAQIATRQHVDPDVLTQALIARWTERITARVENGALTESQATQLREQLATRAKDLVNRTATGGMHGAAVGAGGYGARDGSGPISGTGTCDGTGPHGRGGS
jgi:hypothetical protein